MTTPSKPLAQMIIDHQKAIQDIEKLQKIVDYFRTSFFTSHNTGIYPTMHDVFYDVSEEGRLEWNIMEMYISAISKYTQVLPDLQTLSPADVYVRKLASDRTQFPRHMPVYDHIRHLFVMIAPITDTQVGRQSYRLVIGGVFQSGQWDHRQVDLVPNEQGTYDYH